MEKFEDKQNVPRIILLDVNMPIMDGYETATWIKSNYPDIRILVLSVQEDERTMVRIIRCGAEGYLLKNVRPSELEHALRCMINRGYYYPDWVAHTMISSVVQDRTHEIGQRELEFLNYAATEMTYKEIADKMHCSPRNSGGIPGQSV